MSPPEATPAAVTPAAVIYGCAGTALAAAERAFFRDADPLGFILFARNCESARQIRTLVASLRDAVGRADAPVLIDQEGGRVARLVPPLAHTIPPAARFGTLYAGDAAAGEAAAWAAGRLIARDLAAFGIDVDCAPVLDIARPETTRAIGDRAFAAEPQRVAALGRAVAEGLLCGGVLPVIKHIPGHGRARVDSHLELPVVDAGEAELAASDFAPFRALADLPLGMSAHVRYSALDPHWPATQSQAVIERVIRGAIGFDGLLLSDDLAMQALEGSHGARAARALAAGCDIALHCTGRLGDMQDVAANTGPMSLAAQRRWQNARRRTDSEKPGVSPARRAALADLLGDAGRADALIDGADGAVADALAETLMHI